VVRRLVEQQQCWLENGSASHGDLSMKINLDEKRASKGKAHSGDRSDNVNTNLVGMSAPPTTTEGSRWTFLIFFAESQTCWW
jgi:hypothetical protein